MTHRIMPRFIFFTVALGLAVVGHVAWAGDSSTATRAVRLTYFVGSVSVDQADNSASVPAQVNLPLLAGVRLATGEDGQAEIEFEDGSLVRLTPNSTLSIDSLDIEPGEEGGVGGGFTTSLSLLHGLAYVELRATARYRYRIDAGGDVLSPVENTTVRVNFDEAPAIFAVLDGTARVERQGGTNGAGYQREVRAGESLRGNSADSTMYALTPEIAEESWDTWNEERDRAGAAEAATRTAARDNYAGAQGYGWSDLDANGSWYDVPGQGQIWQPQVAVADPAFDPYGNGAWAWYPGTGYLWASGYTWGWTPYRCGNWSYFSGFGWGWAPGAGSGCGGFGWGFARGGRPVNIGVVPSGYRPIRVPIAGPGPARPILPGRVLAGTRRPVPSTFVQSGPRYIAGVTVVPMEPVGSGYAGRGGSVGSSLRRDFPVDARSHAPVLGISSTQPAVVRTGSGWRSTGERPGMTHPANTGQAGSTSYRGPSGTAPMVRAAPPSGPVAHPSAPVQRGSPPASPPPQPAAHPTYAPAPAAAPARSAPR